MLGRVFRFINSKASIPSFNGFKQIRLLSLSPNLPKEKQHIFDEENEREIINKIRKSSNLFHTIIKICSYMSNRKGGQLNINVVVKSLFQLKHFQLNQKQKLLVKKEDIAITRELYKSFFEQINDVSAKQLEVFIIYICYTFYLFTAMYLIYNNNLYRMFFILLMFLDLN